MSNLLIYCVTCLNHHDLIWFYLDIHSQSLFVNISPEYLVLVGKLMDWLVSGHLLADRDLVLQVQGFDFKLTMA